MLYRILADSLMLIHFAWIVFMLYGVALTIRGFWRPAFFDRWLFRTLHLAGILFVASLEVLGKYCPLTLWENAFRHHYDPSTDYYGHFIIGWIEKLIYYNVELWVVAIPTTVIALFTLLMFVARPPTKFRRAKSAPSISPPV